MMNLEFNPLLDQAIENIIYANALDRSFVADNLRNLCAVSDLPEYTYDLIQNLIFVLEEADN